MNDIFRLIENNRLALISSGMFNSLK